MSIVQGSWCIVLVILGELWIFGSQHAREVLLPCAETVQGTGGHGAAEERTQFVDAHRGPPSRNFDVPEVCAAQAKVYLWHRPTVPSVHPKRTTYCKNRKWTRNVDAVLNSTSCRFYTRFAWWQNYEHRKKILSQYFQTVLAWFLPRTQMRHIVPKLKKPNVLLVCLNMF
jgi:hypothetical protein